MGYRIELSDIEQSLVSIPGIRDAGVVLAESATDSLTELVAYLDIDERISLPDIGPALRNRLPLYMIPKQLIPIARLPRANGGKVDRQALLAHHRETGRKQ
jgi:acyl-coenzyme A synthetase/AMP-(fatty) acid ligase